MKAEIITVGTELLLGDILNSNSQFLSRELASFGIGLHYQSTVGDNPQRLAEELQKALSRSDLIVITGGLGPTPDDLTRETICQCLNMPMELHEDSWKRIIEYFKNTGREMVESNRKQAILPSPCTVFPNDHGTAPGCAVERYGQCIVMLPGPPREMIPMFNDYVAPYLSRYADGLIYSTTVGVFGLSESAVAERIADLLYNENPTVAPYAKEGEVVLRVTARAGNMAEAKAMCEPIVDDIRARLSINVYGVDAGSLQKAVVTLLKEKHLKIATAESCTAGLLSGRLTEVPGVSDVFECGVAAYSNDIKHHVLGVSSDLLEEHGAVSPDVACAMAVGVQQLSHANLGIAITGVAGPDSSEGKPVGMVYIALADDKRTWVKQIGTNHNADDREYIRLLATSHALDLTRRYLEAMPAVMAGGELIHVEKSSHKLSDIPSGPITNTPVSFWKSLLPWVGETRAVKARKFGIWSLILLVIVLTVLLVNALFPNLKPSSLYKDSDAFYDNQGFTDITTNSGYPKDILSQFYTLYDSNTDIRGWLKIDDTPINYPVMQRRGDPDYYSSYSFKNEESELGTPYFDEHAMFFSPESINRNLVIYGNNTHDDQAFSPISRYRDADFLKNHLTMEMNTIYQPGMWHVFSVMLVQDHPSESFEYTRTQFPEENDFLQFVSEIRERSLYDISLDVNEQDSLLMLTLDVSEETGVTGSRLVVVSRLLRKTESPQSLSVTVKNNPDCRLPTALQSTHSKTTTATTKKTMSHSQSTTNHAGSSSFSSSPNHSSATTKPGSTVTTAPVNKPTSSKPTTGSNQIEGLPSASIEESRFMADLNIKDEMGKSITIDSQKMLQKVVACLVKKEMGQASLAMNSTEALKAQAVAGYTFLLYKTSPTMSYTISLSGFDETKGHDKVIYDAVGDVLGVKMVYKNDKNISTMIPYTPYHAASAGITANNHAVFGSSLKHLFSVNSSVETISMAKKYLKSSVQVSSTIKISKSEMHRLLAELIYQTKEKQYTIKYDQGDYIKPTAFDSGAGGVKKYVTKTNAYYINDKNQKIYLTGRDVRSAFDNSSYLMRSHAFTVSASGDTLTFSVNGYGHGVGMSQLGAAVYANEKHWSWQQILKHYYSITSYSEIQIVAPKW